VEYVADTLRNPFGMDPPCEHSVPGYGDTRAHFHVVGDHPGVHGGLEARVPFTGRPWSPSFFGALSRGGLVDGVDPDSGEVRVRRTFLSYLHTCAPGSMTGRADAPTEGDAAGSPTESDYAALEPYFDAELRAVTAHVLLPVGERATRHVFEAYTSRSREAEVDMEALHATETKGSGWLVVPVLEPTDWNDAHADALADALVALRESDYRQTSDLGRFHPGDEPYFVR
jgi:uracil-DNA glycosylase